MGLIRDQGSDYCPWLETKSRSIISSNISSHAKKKKMSVIRSLWDAVPCLTQVGYREKCGRTRVQDVNWIFRWSLRFVSLQQCLFIYVLFCHTPQNTSWNVFIRYAVIAVWSLKKWGVVRNSTGVFYLDNATFGHPPWFCFKFHMHDIQEPVRHLATPPSPHPLFPLVKEHGRDIYPKSTSIYPCRYFEFHNDTLGLILFRSCVQNQGCMKVHF